MSEMNNGGPAFPDSVAIGPAGDLYGSTGMTLRDYFAVSVSANDLAAIDVIEDAEALAGRRRPKGYPNGLDSIKFNMEIEAALRGMFADAMLLERAK